MADKLKFDLVSPERLVLSADVDAVQVPGAEGDFGVLPKHAPFMAMLRAGMLVVENDGKTQDIELDVGFVGVTPEGVIVRVASIGV